MAHDIGFVDNTGSEGVAHWQMLLKIKTLAEANGWTTLRYLNPTPFTDKTVIRELILQGSGLSGTEQIFIGFRAYQDQTSDYYNLTVASFTGYVAAQSFTTQPGYIESGVCAHNQRIDYWLAVNGQRIKFCLKVGAVAVYEMGYTGKFFPYATPSQYPYPMALCGTLPSATPATRYSDLSTTHAFGARGSNVNSAGAILNPANGWLRNVSGTWIRFGCQPWFDTYNPSPTIRRDTSGSYLSLKSVMFDGPSGNTSKGNVWGELDGIEYISGFNNVSENYWQEGGTPVTPNPSWTPAQADAAIVAAGGVSNFMFGDGWRTGIGDYFAMRMD